MRPIFPPDVIAGRYAVGRLAASGGMATLYRASDVISQEVVAVKVLRASLAEGGRGGDRFLREARTLRGLDHPAIVRYLDHGVDARLGPFLVMEWIEGEPLDAVLRERGLRPEEALAVAHRIVGALAHVHARGIVHRDVKPSNILLPGGLAEGAVLVDFGIAADSESETRATQTGVVLGTPRYMAPEQLRSAKSVDGRADVFGLGCGVYELLTGKHPFGGTDVYSHAARLAAGEAAPAFVVRRSLPEAVSRVVARMIARDPPVRAAAGDGLLLEIEAAIRAVEGLGLAPVVGAAPADEDDVEPGASSPETLPTYGEVASVATRAVAEPEVRGPRPSGPFFGRVHERAELRARLGSGAAGVLWGAPGIGKSRLAFEICEDLVRGPGAREGAMGFVVSLRSARDRAGLLRLVLDMLGMGAVGHEPDVASVGRMLRAWGHPVIVLDGADRVLADAAEAARAWSAPRVGATVILTARSRADVPGGAAIELGPLAPSVEGGSPGPGVALLLSTSGARERPLDEAETQAARAIVEALDGNPLALELAAARIPVLGLSGLAERLDQPLALLGATGGAGALSMTDALEWSYELLSREEQRALAECAVFRGPFSVRAAEAALTADVGAQVVDLLGALRRSSLVREIPGSGERRLVLARTVREFARGKLSREDASAVERRRNAYLVPWAWSLAAEVSSTGSAQSLAQLVEDADALFDVVESALGTAEATEEVARTGLQAAVALEPVVAMRGPVGRYLELLERGLRLVGGREELIGHARRARGNLLRRRAPGPARVDLEEACAIGAACGAWELEAEARLTLGALHQWSQEFDEAARMYRAVLDGPGDGRAMRAEARAFTNLATLEHEVRRLDEAKVLYEEGISLLQTLGDERLTAKARMHLAILLQERGERADARTHYTAAAATLRKLGDDHSLALTLQNMGMLDFEEGQLDAARQHLETARSLFARRGDLRTETLAVGFLAAVLGLQGRAQQALGAAVLAERMAARHDGAVRATVRLLRAFVDLAQADEARRAGAHGVAENALVSARTRVRSVTAPAAIDRTVTTLSDDARTALRVLEACMPGA